jgi:hypothetical protein
MATLLLLYHTDNTIKNCIAIIGLDDEEEGEMIMMMMMLIVIVAADVVLVVLLRMYSHILTF